jgi:UDP-N-acetylglucosamine:LPS N-acetylglucosamine transferase
MTKPRVLILSSRTGGGHQSAAMALEESFGRLSSGRILVNITQVLEEAHFMTHQFARLYNHLLRHHQQYMKYYYGAIEALKLYDSNLVFQASRRYGERILSRIKPSVLVSVHPMTQHFFAFLLRQLNLIDKIPLVTVVTDPCKGFWKGWACEDVQTYYVAHPQAKEQLEFYGISSERIQVMGMPVHSRFKPLAGLDEKQALRSHLGLAAERFTLLVNAGWAGGGNMAQLLDALIESPVPNTQVVFVTGHNQDLYQYAQSRHAQAKFPLTIVPYTQDLNLYMNAADILVSKLGGLTTFEAFASELPIFADCLTPPMPQELGTASLITSESAGVLLQNSQHFIEQVTYYSQHAGAYTALKKASSRIGQPGAVDRITQDILTRY